MKKEAFKTCLLVFLVCSSIVLTVQMWFREKLWPDGYNFFATIGNHIRIAAPLKSTLTKESVSYPKRMIVSNFETEKRSVYMPGSSKASALTDEVKSLLCLALSGSEGESAQPGEWDRALQTKSIYVEYPVAFDAKIFSDILGVGNAPGISVKWVKEFIISEGDTVSTFLSIYVKDAQNGQVVKVPVRYDKQAFSAIVESNATDSIGDYRFSAELKFDTSAGGINGDRVEQKLIISPNVLLALKPQQYSVMKEHNLLFANQYDEELIHSILRAFGFNVSGIRRYVEGDNSVVYVENYGSIKFYEDGFMEYQAVDETKGITLSGKTNASAYDSFISGIDFVNSLWENALPGKPLNINLSSDVTDEKNKGFSVYLDYSAEGVRISCNPFGVHAIEMKIANDQMVYYRQKFAIFEPTDKTAQSISAIDALNHLYAGQRADTSVITDIFPIYHSADGSLWQTVWAAKTGSGEEFVIGN